MSQIICVAAVLTALSCGPAFAEGKSPERAYTMEECIETGLERSLKLSNARRGEHMAEETIRRIRAQALPSLDASSTYTRLGEVYSFPGVDEPFGREDNYTAGVEAGQLLYSGGGVRAALRAARDYREFASQDTARQKSVLIRDIRQTFVEALYARKAVEVAEASVDQLAAFEKQAKTRYKNETTSEFDWLSAQVNLANEKPKLVQARNQLELVMTALKDLVYAEDDDFSITGELEYRPAKISLEELNEMADRNRPELRQAQLNVQMQEENIRVARSDYFPEIRAFANYSGTNPGQEEPAVEEWEWGWNAGLTASWSIMDGGLKKAEIRTTRMKRDIAVTEQEDLRIQIRQEIKNAFLALQHAEEVVLSTQESVALAEKALEIARVRYDEGLATHLEFADSNLALRSAKLYHYMALKSHQQALAALDYACGVNDLKDNAEQAGK
ncbi:MAG: TolC family protein [Kiritimatiellia bacterium]